MLFDNAHGDTDFYFSSDKELLLYCADEWSEKQKLIAALNRLTKQQQMFLYTEVIGFITRYNTAAAMLSDTDMAELLEHENKLQLCKRFQTPKH